MQNYLHNIITRISKPLRIRVGGNGMDGSTYVPNLKTFLQFTDPNAYFNDIPVNFGPIMFDVMNKMYDTVGAMQFIIGLSMRKPEDTSNVVLLAAAAEERLGNRLDAFLLGNTIPMLKANLYQFAASLWTVDVGLKAASVNYSAIYIHTREYGVTYNLFDPPTVDTSTSLGWVTGAVYYSALFLSEMTDPSGTVIVDLNLNNSNASPEATVAAYGIYHNAGASRGKLALINFADGAESASQVYRIPANISDDISIRYLNAPSVTERRNISWAGQTVGDNGDLIGTQETVKRNCTGGCEVEVPSPGAALVFLSGSEFFTGNSTLAAPYGYPSGAMARRDAASYAVSFTMAVIVICIVS
ncbi:hypothetical protein H0H87_009390 [Tephrocybe sp. NHM501043]|nr:hypothetical protein H0H87_009390 [Tephrocybe sp. NHM501043]